MAGRELIVIGGANGAGKSTIADEYVAQYGYRYLSADAIAAQLSPQMPSMARIHAGREFHGRVNECLGEGGSFIVESTLSGVTFQRVMRKAKSRGYTVTTAYLFVDSAETCVERVRERVQKGGHDVPEADVRRRFRRSLMNFWEIYRELSDRWMLIYNSEVKPVEVVVGTSAFSTIRNANLFEQFKRLI